ncbi:MAG TPA: Hsp20/alpha crystallin family protein [Tepidisphaeraceae bacterium]|nr:Hsp20/alpha crystallin family protein [Tepidisphaeraceae bacterium]
MLARMMTDFAPLARLQDEMNQMFESVFEDAPSLRGYAAGYPGVNLWEAGDAAYVEAELPGLGMEDIEVLVTGNEVTINGERKIAEPENAAYHRRERAAGRFSRVLTLPWEIDAEKVQATLHDGVLTVTLPKCESCKPRKIEVKALPAA